MNLALLHDEEICVPLPYTRLFDKHFGNINLSRTMSSHCHLHFTLRTYAKFKSRNQKKNQFFPVLP